MIAKIYALEEKLFQECMMSEGCEERVLTKAEAVLVDIVSFVAIIKGSKDFQTVFEDGFAAEFMAKRFDTIGHRLASCTIRLAHRIACTSPSDPTLKFLAYSFCEMESTILYKLGVFQSEKCRDRL